MKRITQVIVAAMLATVARCEGAAPTPAGRLPGLEGKPAPDFALHRLVIEKDEEGRWLGSPGKDTVRLSSFRGTKPVLIIFGGCG